MKINIVKTLVFINASISINVNVSFVGNVEDFIGSRGAICAQR